MEFLVVDGYNIINAWDDVFDIRNETLEDCRNKLVSILSNYQGYKNVNVIVVFDAHLVKGSQEKIEYVDNIMVVYTKENETADIYIERFVHRRGNSCTIRVATSDYMEQSIVLSGGGVRMTPRELREEINMAARGIEEEIDRNRSKHRDNTIMSRLNPDLLKELEKIRRGKF